MSTYHCPTCNAPVAEGQEVHYFAADTATPLADDASGVWHEEADGMVELLGAVAIATPLAVAYASGDGSGPEWADTLAGLAKELKEELHRRLLRVRRAGVVWQERAEALERRARQ